MIGPSEKRTDEGRDERKNGRKDEWTDYGKDKLFYRNDRHTSFISRSCHYVSK